MGGSLGLAPFASRMDRLTLHRIDEMVTLQLSVTSRMISAVVSLSSWSLQLSCAPTPVRRGTLPRGLPRGN